MQAQLDAPRRVDPRPALGILAWLIYVVTLLVFSLIGGVDYDEIASSSHNILIGIIFPVGIACVVMVAFAYYLGWDEVFSEAPVRPRLWWAIPGGMIVGIISGLIAAKWGDWNGGTIVLLLIGTLMVGFGEEIATRGLLLGGLRGGGLSESRVWLVSTLCFALMHGLNVLAGQAVGKTLAQMVATFFIGSVLYGTRRVTGLLIAGMLVHAFWDFALFALRGPGNSALGEATHAGNGAIAGLFLIVSVVVTLILLRKLFASRDRNRDFRQQHEEAVPVV